MHIAKQLAAIGQSFVLRPVGPDAMKQMYCVLQVIAVPTIAIRVALRKSLRAKRQAAVL